MLLLVYVDGREVDGCEATHLAQEWRFTAVPLHVMSQGTWGCEGTMTFATLVHRPPCIDKLTHIDHNIPSARTEGLCIQLV